MAPPSSRRSQTTKLSSIPPPIKTSNFGRVSKATRLNSLGVKSTEAQKEALVKILEIKEEEKDVSTIELELNEEKKKQQIVSIETKPEVKRLNKRKIDDVESEDEDGLEKKDPVVLTKTRGPIGRKLKARKIQLLSPPASRCGTDTESSSPEKATFNSVKIVIRSVEFPSALHDMLSLHAAFLKALSLHFAHNGPSSPAELNSLMASMTRIWKKLVVSKEMIQRMLALYEIGERSDVTHNEVVEHRNGPFKLATFGLGMGVRTTVELIGQGSISKAFDEKKMQVEYEKIVQSIFDVFRKDTIPNFLGGPISGFPLLAIPVGLQTQARQGKASATRTEILGLSNAAQSRLPNFAKLSIDSDQSDSMSTPASTKSRTLSLFDRVRAKGLASSSNAAPTNEQILRRHAVGRIAEVVEFLRMKQQQKLGALFMSSNQSPSNQMMRAKVSFSLNSIVNEIRQSVPIPIGDEEIRCCLKVLGEEVPHWLSCLNMGTVQSVTLVGQVMSGVQVRKMIEEKGRKA